MDGRIKQNGLIYIPKEMAPDEKVSFAWVAGYLKGVTLGSLHSLEGHLIYPGYDGLHDSSQKEDKMEFSWTGLTIFKAFSSYSLLFSFFIG